MRIPFHLILLALLVLSCKKESPVSPDEGPKPRLHIVVPLGGSLITGPVNIEIYPDQTSKVQLVEFFIDGVSIGTDSLPPPFSKTWFAGFWADGLQHQIFGIGRDPSGDTSHAGPVIVTVSADAQAIGIGTPGPGQIVQGPMLITLLTPNEIVLVSAEFVLDGSITLTRDTTAPFEKIWNPAFWADGGIHMLSVDVEDSSGRTGKAGPVSVTIPTDVLGYPVPVFPSNLLVVDDLQQTFRWNASPTATSYEIEISPEPDFSEVEWTATVTDTLYTATLNERSLYFWRVRAFNEFQNSTRWADAEFATTPTFRIIRSYAGFERATSVDITTDGGYVITGSWEDGGVKVIKTDRFATEQWSVNFGAPSDYGFSIRQTSDGGYVVAARMESSTEGRFAILKLNSAGGQSWLRRYGREWDEGAQSVFETQDGGFVAAGYVTVLPNFYQRAWLTKTSASGDSLWARTYNHSALTHGVKVLQTQDNGILLLGAEYQLASDTVASMLPPDLWLLRTNANGDSLWSMTYGDMEDDFPADAAVAGAGYVILGHSSISGTGFYDIVLRRIDDAGSVQWSKTFGTSARNDYAQAVVATTGGGYFLAGITSENMDNTSDVFLIRTDMNGDSLWTKKFGSNLDDVAFSAREAPDGGFIVVGQHEQDILIIKTDHRGRIGGLFY